MHMKPLFIWSRGISGSTHMGVCCRLGDEIEFCQAEWCFLWSLPQQIQPLQRVQRSYVISSIVLKVSPATLTLTGWHEIECNCNTNVVWPSAVE